MRSRASFVLGLAMSAVVAASGVGCGWDPRRPFERESPEVSRATALYDAGDARAAATALEEYLGTGACREGAIGAPQSLGEHKEGTFDLSLALFAIADAYGARFESDGKAAAPPDADPKARTEMITCALRIARAVIEAPGTPYALLAKAHYVEGNLHFLSGDFEKAIASYERALLLVPGAPAIDAGPGAPVPEDQVGRDAAWNRAVAMRRLDDQKDAGPDASSDASSDGGGQSDAGQDGGKNDGGKNDAGNDGGGGGPKEDGGGEGGTSNDKNDKDSGPPPSGQDAGQSGDDGGSHDSPPPENTDDRGASATPDERILNDLERAPLLQQELSRRAAQNRRVRGAADK